MNHGPGVGNIGRGGPPRPMTEWAIADREAVELAAIAGFRIGDPLACRVETEWSGLDDLLAGWPVRGTLRWQRKRRKRA